jgi:CRP-like cAMP-binding protein
LVRFAVEKLIEGNSLSSSGQVHQSALQERLADLESKYDELLSQNREILDNIANFSVSPQVERLIIWQKEMILNLIRECPRSEEEIRQLIPELSEIEVLRILNELIETSLISLEGEKYQYCEVV